MAAVDQVLENPYSGQGAVLLDIGGDVGALVVSMPAGMDGVEVEIHPEHEHAAHRVDHGHEAHRHHPHVAVVARPTDAGIVHSLVYGEVTAGRYRLHPLPDGPSVLAVEVVGGRVTEAIWPAA